MYRLEMLCVGRMTVEDEKDWVFFCWSHIRLQMFKPLHKKVRIHPSAFVVCHKRASRSILAQHWCHPYPPDYQHGWYVRASTTRTTHYRCCGASFTTRQSTDLFLPLHRKNFSRFLNRCEAGFIHVENPGTS